MKKSETRSFWRKKLCKPLLAMKITLMLIVLNAMQLSASVYSQNTKLDLNMTNQSLVEVFKEIRNNSDFTFVYDLEDVETVNNLDIDQRGATVEEILDNCFLNTNLSYEIVDKVVIVKQKPIVAPKPVQQEKKEIHGRVMDTHGIPLPGVSVVVKGTMIGTSTDVDGNYSIEVDDNPVLIFSFVGMQKQEVKIAQRSVVNVVMVAESQVFDEVQVIAYGTSSIRLNTGSVSSVKSDKLTSQPVANPMNALSGRVSGVVIQQNNGLPGSSTSLQIRGRSSLSSGTEPLYVIDGVAFSNENLNSFGIGAASGGISPFSVINPMDIERIDVLKDADATAIYGARASNGVVLITTKRGETGKAKLDVNVYTGAGKVGHFIPMMNTDEYLGMRREAFKNDGVEPDEYNAPDLMAYDQKAYTNWQKLLIGGTAHTTDVQATLHGGSEMVKFLVNANFRNEGTVFPGNQGSTKAGARMNLDYGSKDGKFKATFSGAFSNDKTDMYANDLTRFYSLPPNYPVYNEDGTLFWDYYQDNPIANLQQTYKGITNNLMGNSTLSYSPIDKLYLKVNLGYTQTTLEQKSKYPVSSFNPSYGMTSFAMFANNKMTNYIIEPTGSYSISGDNWTLNTLLGASLQRNITSGSSLEGSNYSSDALLGAISGAGLISSLYEDSSEYSFASLFGRITYNFKQKYILNVNYRRDGSSKFGDNNRFGNFGSAGVAWLFSGEPFIKEGVPFLSFGKLRTSYGVTGNDQIDNYLYLALYDIGTTYNNSASLNLKTLSNPNIQWETTRKFEMALDLGFFKDRLLLAANYYMNRSSNQIVNVKTASQSGFNYSIQNLDAVVQNTGLEFDLSSTNIDGEDFKWSTNFNISFPKNKLVSFPGLEGSNFSDLYEIGKPINASKYYQYAGIDSSTGKVLYTDKDNDGEADYEYAPVGTPFYGGLSNTFTYKNWSFDFLIQFSHRKGQTNNISEYQYESVLGTMANQNTSALNRWRSPGDENTRFPGASANYGTDIYDSYDNYSYSNANYGDASFVRFKSINLAYNLPNQWIEKLKISSARIYFQGQNLYTATKNKYVFDPETSGIGIGTMPPLRTFVLGINCSF
ncbi:SusC/RagA family TonB-linked outer membrane protein [Labilibaculum sp. A4]|uniref:TonB-dependent receptor n=1 Tax=Labilibaculum euxinus TaxID=2686357 RepID=UPI000F61CCE4|nr:TonB-dependent receptor [Labilibaculum euxinus]MDQ1770624.1 TonB-dependent receptor [Labilibaculum euxinus]MWN75156.1 SusC/RagA family TonB-linked outer membrane protein [Labilibaculum euxinus]